ncbi:hypothetical protein M2323_004256 [Rhodoblastus acidophilus]|uniref:hypothetical protein n=1 Tax=Rhodoblastus acidophilus TaxID=1074 RepID=UPI0022253DD8|nr:hypothetical protein [Rhodoblastus acidophilus]MCW2286461.1 hypothetical protein [Rhodoblastus acidophilus]MCW2335310.1 hypothetical protein [Rhodoblastus acidophilus]
MSHSTYIAFDSASPARTRAKGSGEVRRRVMAEPPPIQSSARDFRDLVDARRREQAMLRQRAAAQAQRQREEQASALLNASVSEDEWRLVLDGARRAAQQGREEFALLRFPASLCEDGGRAVNCPDPDWPSTLRGKAADFCRLWRADLKPLGFRLSARVVSFPDGLLGDIELALGW